MGLYFQKNKWTICPILACCQLTELFSLCAWVSLAAVCGCFAFPVNRHRMVSMFLPRFPQMFDYLVIK